MASFVLFIFTLFLLSVARSANLTQCNVCGDGGDAPCSGGVESKNCTETGTCVGVSSVTTLSIDNIKISAFSRTCVEPSNNVIGSFHFDFGNASTLGFTSKACAEKDPGCSVTRLDPPIRMYENGKTCPKCFRTGHDNCDSDGEVLCVGDLVNCIELNGEIAHTYSALNITTTIPFAGKGCVTPSVCDIGQNKSVNLGSYTFTFKNFNCFKANGALSSLRRLAFTLEKKDLGPQVAFFLPCLLGIFAVKMLS